MKKTNKIIITTVIVAVLLLGIGYAAIQNITLNIEGTATADPSQSNFKVMFTGTPKVSDSTYVTAGITDDINATISVNGLTQKGQIVSAEYTVQNVSTDISADLSVATTNSNTEYFTLKSELAKTSLTAGEATTVKVTVELTKTPITGSINSTIGVRLTAMPVEPGQEGTSEGINGSSQTPKSTLASVTNANIGDYIDLGNNIVGTEATTDDWRILYKEGDTVYAILADYLPNSTGYAEKAGLGVDNEYNVSPYVGTSNAGTSNTISIDTFINILKDTTAWNELANKIEGATVIGSPTVELLINSYNTKNGTELIYTEYPQLDSKTIDYDLYVTEGYFCWLASPDTSIGDYIWSVCSTGFNGDGYHIESFNYTDAWYASSIIRPVVSLPTSITAELVDGVWTIEK